MATFLEVNGYRFYINIIRLHKMEYKQLEIKCYSRQIHNYQNPCNTTDLYNPNEPSLQITKEKLSLFHFLFPTAFINRYKGFR